MKLVSKLELIHKFWFRGYPKTKINTAELMQLWYKKDTNTDSAIRQEFEQTVNYLISDNFQINQLSNKSEFNSNNVLSVTIALDQFTRNIFRNTPKSFEGDHKALAISKQVLGVDPLLKDYAALEKMFMLMPLEHSENLKDQRLSVEKFNEFRELEQDKNMDEFWNGVCDYAVAHLKVIEQFGRFPHRNEILNRPHTPEEDHYLKNGGVTF